MISAPRQWPTLRRYGIGVRTEGGGRIKTSPEVERWFAEKKPPAEATIRRVREIILRADRRMTEFVKYGTLTFGFDGDFATLVQVSNKKQTRSAELSKIVVAWCSLTPAERGSAKKA